MAMALEIAIFLKMKHLQNLEYNTYLNGPKFWIPALQKLVRATRLGRKSENNLVLTKKMAI